MQPMISVNNVSKKYSSHLALDNISFDVKPGSVFGLLGPNGAGKTSLIRIINQITGPDSGTVLFKGDALKMHHVEKIGYLPEERGLYKKMTVGDQVLYLARLKGLSRQDAKKRIRHWFEKFDMAGWSNKKVEELSKGMQQKVQFIVTVIHEPELLILDEPFSGFDPINAMLIRDEILSLRQKGATIILSTHNMSSVEELCDHIALLNRAQLILDGKVSEIRKQFRSNTYRIVFKGEVLGFTNALWTAAEITEKHTEDSIHTFTLKAAPNVTGSSLLKAVIPFCEIFSFNEIVPGMNEIFIKQVSINKDLTLKGEHTE
jgi:ABC-2 type transport system ATP-binding protein